MKKVKKKIIKIVEKEGKFKLFFVKFKHKIKNILLFVVFVSSLVFSWAFALYSFIFAAVMFVVKIFTNKIPLETKKFRGPHTYVYKVKEKEELKMDIYYPEEYLDSNPVVYFAHGGGWVSGYRNQPNNVSWCRYLASKGFAVVSIDYDLAPKDTMEGLLKNYTDGLDFLRKNSIRFRLDTKKIILMGLSAGGHLSLFYSTFNSYMNNENRMDGIKGVVAYYAPSRLEDILSKKTRSIFAKMATITTLKGVPKDMKEEYRKYSPITWVSERMVPTFLAHGKNDDVVPIDSSYDLFRKLKRLNVTSEMEVHRYGNHQFEFELKDVQTINIIRKTVHFMKEILI